VLRTRVDLGQRGVDRVGLAQVQAEQEAVVVGEPPGQRRAQPRRLGLDPGVDQGEQPVGVALARDQRLQDRPPAQARDVGQHRGELEVGVLERLLQPLHVAGPLADQLLAGAQQGAQRLDGRIRHEARPDQAVRQQLGQPGGVRHVGLAPRHVPHLRRVGQDQHQIAVGQHVPHRLPVHPGRLHRGVGAAALGQPSGQRQQAGRGGVEPAHLGVHRPGLRQPHRGDHAVLVHIQPRAPRVENLHRALPPAPPPAQDAPNAKSRRRAPGPHGGPWRNRGCFRRPGSN
jgi:hypothetical protein